VNNVLTLDQALSWSAGLGVALRYTGAAPDLGAHELAGDLIFKDGFQAGQLTAWSSSQTDGGDLAVDGTAGMGGTSLGLRGIVDDTNAMYVQDDSPTDEARYRARFYFSPNGFNPGEQLASFRTRIFIAFEEGPVRRLVAIVLKRQGGEYSIMGRVRQDDDSQADTSFFPISDAPHSIEFDWIRSSAAGANDGRFELWIDGVSVSVLEYLDNSRSAVDFTRMGALSLKAGASGTPYWDQFESRRWSYIGF
jgi:hypothetical protein